MAVVANLPLLPTLDREQLAVHLEARDAKDHLNTRLGEAVSHLDIRLLVKSRSKLNHGDNAFPVM